MKSSVLFFIRVFSVFFLVLIFSGGRLAGATDLVPPGDGQELRKYAAGVDEEYSYRKKVDSEGARWAQDLMFMYKLPLLAKAAGYNAPDIRDQRLQAEIAWLTVWGHGMAASFDFSHAHQSLVGSTSRFVKTLFLSPSFWNEVRNQCVELTNSEFDGKLDTKECAERLKRDIEISQVVGSNVSIFIGSGVAIGLAKRVFQKYAATWVTARVLPLLPAFVKTKWAVGALVVGIVAIPTAFVMASADEEHEKNKAFYENLPTVLRETNAEADKASVMRQAALLTERRVLEFTIWAKPRVPSLTQAGTDEFQQRTREFISDVRFLAPHFSTLVAQEVELQAVRSRLETELASVPGLSARLLELAELKKQGSLSEADTKLLRSAQYLASLRLTLKIIAAAKYTP